MEGITFFNRAVSFSSSVSGAAIFESFESEESVVYGIDGFLFKLSGLSTGLLIGLLDGGLCGARGDYRDTLVLLYSVSPLDRVTAGVEGI